MHFGEFLLIFHENVGKSEFFKFLEAFLLKNKDF